MNCQTASMILVGSNALLFMTGLLPPRRQAAAYPSRVSASLTIVTRMLITERSGVSIR
jgi:hypothetical protein